MSRFVFVLSSILAIVLTVSVSLMSVSASLDLSTKVDISTYGSVTHIYNGSTDTVSAFTPDYFYINSSTEPLLYDLGIRNMFQVPAIKANILLNSGSYIHATNFSSFYSSELYTSLQSVNILDYEYLTCTVIIGLYDREGYAISGADVRCALTAEFSDGTFDNTFVDLIQGSEGYRCFTFGLSTRDTNLSFQFPSNPSLALLLGALELLIYPTINSRATFNVLMSDISFRFYTSEDALTNSIGSLEDAINNGNKEVLDKLDSLEGSISQGTKDIVNKLDSLEDTIINGDVSVDNTDLNGINGAVGDLGDVEDAVNNATPEWDPSILTGVPDDLTNTLGYIGNKLMLIVDGPLGVVVFFCLSFGLCMTLAGRSVR